MDFGRYPPDLKSIHSLLPDFGDPYLIFDPTNPRRRCSHELASDS
jgi:hypothetical protein